MEVMVSFTPQPLYLQGKSPWCPLDRRLGGPQSLSGHGGEEKNSQPPPGIELLPGVDYTPCRPFQVSVSYFLTTIHRNVLFIKVFLSVLINGSTKHRGRGVRQPYLFHSVQHIQYTILRI
jgi:hypothetical protein